MTQLSKIAVSFHCDTRNAFSIHSHLATVVKNIRIVMQNVGKDLEQDLVGCFAEFKINSSILHCFTASKRKIYRQYRDTRAMEWTSERMIPRAVRFGTTILRQL